MPHQIISQTRRLPAKQYNYFNGLRHFNTILPNNIICFRRTNNANIQFHARHHRFVLVISLRGKGTAVLNGHTIALPATHGLLIFPHQTHFFSAPSMMHWLFVTFEQGGSDWLQPLHNSPVRLSAQCLTMLDDLLQQYLSRDLTPWHGSRCALDLAWTLHAMLALHGMAPVPEQPMADQPGHEMLVERINRFVYEHLDRHLTIPTIAGAVGLSPSYLRTLFRKKIKTSLGVYMRNIRLGKAIDQLAGTDQLIKEIAHATGFASTASFIMFFQRRMGLTPGQYRRQLKSTPPPAIHAVRRRRSSRRP